MKYDNCKDCQSECEHAGKNRDFICMKGVSCKVTKAKPMTNADRIRAMSDEELAEFLCEVYDDDTCSVYGAESGKFICGITIMDYDVFKIVEWLRQSAEEVEK